MFSLNILDNLIYSKNQNEVAVELHIISFFYRHPVILICFKNKTQYFVLRQCDCWETATSGMIWFKWM